MNDRRLPRRDSNRAIHPASFSKASLIVEVPRQRNSREHNATVKSGEVPKEWKGQPNKLRQKDTDARWTKKRGQSYYGYKNHVSADRDTKFIDRYEVTASSRHDSPIFGEFLPDSPAGDAQVWADSAYRAQDGVEEFRKRDFKPRINDKGTRSKELTERQADLMRAYSKVRSRVEHVFGAMRMEMPEHRMRCIGRKRARAWIGLRNLWYNIWRLKSLEASSVAASGQLCPDGGIRG